MCVDQDDTAAVVSTVLLVTGVNTLLHMLIGTRLPLVQGRPPFNLFVYLAPALVIINSPEFFGLNDNVCIFSFVLWCFSAYNMANVAVMHCSLGFGPLAVLTELNSLHLIAEF